MTAVRALADRYLERLLPLDPLLATMLGQPGYDDRLTDYSPDGEAAMGPRLGDLPLARRDVERLKQVLGLQRRIRDRDANLRVQRTLTHRSVFREALTWLEVHGNAPEVAAHWKSMLAERGAYLPAVSEVDSETPTFRRRRRRRRRCARPLHQ